MMSRRDSSRRVYFTVAALIAFATLYSTAGWAQGQNVVYNGSGTTTSSAYLDASAFSTSSDICARINAALNAVTVAGTVVDARGITSSLTCTGTHTPWVDTNTITIASTVLLPAATIVINTGWTLPAGTRIIGEGGGSDTSSAVTTIQASSTFASTFMISMGSSSTTICPANVCNGISVENLRLDGQSKSITGVLNNYSQESSYVKHVTFYQINGTGLSVGPSSPGNPVNSGPYSDLTCSFVSTAPASTTLCAVITGASTRGIHGMTCTNSTATKPSTAISVSGSNDSIEDVQMQGFVNGVAIGPRSSTSGILAKNITGSSGMTTTVIISNSFTPSDIAILGVNANGATNTIQDLSTTTTLTSATDPIVATYMLGKSESVSGTVTGHTRFTTSASVPSWVQGSVAPTGTCKIGSLYSYATAASGTDALYVCVPSGSTTKWSGVK